jgi:hypothetical protein
LQSTPSRQKGATRKATEKKEAARKPTKRWRRELSAKERVREGGAPTLVVMSAGYS